MTSNINPQEVAGAKSATVGCPCSEAKGHVWDFLDGELDSDNCARIKEHLESCEECKGCYEAEQQLKDAVSRTCGCEGLPQDLDGKVSSLVSRLKAELCGDDRRK